jgi:hypothetical protein
MIRTYRLAWDASDVMEVMRIELAEAANKSNFLVSLSDEALRTMIDCFAKCPTTMGQSMSAGRFGFRNPSQG